MLKKTVNFLYTLLYLKRDFGEVKYTLLYFKCITSKDLLYRTWNSAQGYVPAWTGGGFGRERIPVYVWLSPFAAHLKLPQHCQSTVPQYRIKSSQEKRKQERKMSIVHP